MNLKHFEAFVTCLEEAYGDPDHVNTAGHALNKLCQGNHDLVTYFAKFQCIVTNLNWNNGAKHATLYCSLSEDLKDILSNQDLPKDWNSSVALMKRHDM
jgi:hypothetical protein